MAFGFDLTAMLDKLADSPQVKLAMDQFVELRNGVVSAAAHFNSCFDDAAQQRKMANMLLVNMDRKLDRILFLLEHPSDVAPAGDDGLMAALDAAGTPMLMQEVQHESENTEVIHIPV